MKQVIETQNDLFQQFQKQHTQFIQNIQNKKFHIEIIELLNKFNNDLITITGDLQDINDIFKNNTHDLPRIQQKIKEFQQVQDKIKEFLPYLILNTV